MYYSGRNRKTASTLNSLPSVADHYLKRTIRNIEELRKAIMAMWGRTRDTRLGHDFEYGVISQCIEYRHAMANDP